MTGWLGRELRELELCESTSDEAAALAAAGAPHGTVVVAAAQRRGRGRLGRAWFSPAGENLYLSCVLRPDLPAAALPAVTLAAGIAVHDAVAAFGARAALKWPNDVLASGRKLAGLLAEMTTQGARLDHLILGIGVNLGSRGFPPELESIATSLALETGHLVSPAGFRAALLPELEIWLDRFFRGGVAAIAPAWTERSVKGARVRVMDGSREVSGVACGIHPDGSLDVRDDRGHHVKVVAGDVILLPSGRGGER